MPHISENRYHSVPRNGCKAPESERDKLTSIRTALLRSVKPGAFGIEAVLRGCKIYVRIYHASVRCMCPVVEGLSSLRSSADDLKNKFRHDQLVEGADHADETNGQVAYPSVLPVTIYPFGNWDLTKVGPRSPSKQQKEAKDIAIERGREDIRRRGLPTDDAPTEKHFYRVCTLFELQYKGV
ncbi:hypothetical protein PCH_Pc19g00690 [Penicillium rubens Wisconsin 54-1255]|uniref:Uncharacterized protein n=1 Tax=Penicillium rubens (strain ATCC 28089 / DSM 1075 / NRRL 1951 / Wisconsin 54-1255) TaxID=500485 RepID=B6HD56_PENRW|nr:hypothetical protein PCH_Pc19g00690 [Penicillium rubens Wisconsin 54-1255]